MLQFSGARLGGEESGLPPPNNMEDDGLLF